LLKDLSPLAPVFADERIRKVFHGADYDIRSLYRDFGIEVRSLFDTQIAARFLGCKEFGLAALLHQYFGVVSEKKYQKKDWSRRPLPSPMLQYAVQDICYLLPLARILEKALKKRGRLFCVEEECDLLRRVRPNPPNNGPLFMGFKGASKLAPRSLAVLESVLQFRDQMARHRDSPHFKVMGNQPVMEIAERKPRSRAELSEIRGLSLKQIDQMGDGIVKSIQKSLRLPQKDLPKYPRRTWRRLSSKAAARVKALKIWRDRAGEAWGVDPSLICTNAQMQAIAEARPEKPEDMNAIDDIRKWQIQLLGSDICDLIREK